MRGVTIEGEFAVQRMRLAASEHPELGRLRDRIAALWPDRPTGIDGLKSW